MKQYLYYVKALTYAPGSLEISLSLFNIKKKDKNMNLLPESKMTLRPFELPKIMK